MTKLVKDNKKNQQEMKEDKMKKMIYAAIAVVACICVVGGLGALRNSGNKLTGAENTSGMKDTLVTEGSADGTSTTEGSETATALDAALTYYADIEIQDYGTITIQLDQTSAPITVENFVNLAESGFYDGLTFHRIMAGFMMQGGDPLGNGTGGAENTIVGEFSENGHDNKLSHTRGAVSMARSQYYDSASSQFFIVHEDSTFLDGQYAAFGYVTEGMDVVDAVCETAVPIDRNGTIPAEEQPVIVKVVIRAE